MKQLLAKVRRWWNGPERPCVRCRHYAPEVLWPDNGETEWDGVSVTRSYCALRQAATGPRDTCDQWEPKP